MKRTAIGFLVAAVVLAGFMAFGFLAIDAYEFERTGQCLECVLLHKLRDLS